MTEPIATVEQLVAAREARGLSAEDMIRQLKLHPRQLDALERGDWSSLPGVPFVRGTIRNYAKVLDVDVGPLLESIGGFAKPADLRTAARVEATLPANGMMGFGNAGAGSHWIWLLLVLAGLVALALFLGKDGDLSSMSSWLSTKSDTAPATAPPPAASEDAAKGSRTEAVPIAPQGPTPPASTGSAAPAGAAAQQGSAAAGPSTAPAPATAGDATVPAATAGSAAAGGTEAAAAAGAPATAGTPDAAAPTPAQAKPRLRLSYDADAWIEVRSADGKPLLLGTQKANTVNDLELDGKVTLVIGNADKVHVQYQGKPVTLHPKPGTGVARLTLP